MALVFNDRVKETSTTTGTGTLDLGGAFQDFQTFVAGIGNSNETYYNIVLPQTGEFEVGRGVVTDASPDTLSRLEVFTSSNSGNLVDFSAGTKTVFCTLPASKAVIEDASNNVTLPADLTVDTNTLHVDSSNKRVGINTTSPTQALTIDGGNNAKIQFLGGGFQSIYYGDSGTNVRAFVHYDHNSDNYQIDVPVTATIDAPSGLRLADSGTQFGQLEDSSNDFVISSVVQDKDLIFKGNDGGSAIDALSFDMSEAGAATFNSTVTANAGLKADNITIDGTEIDLSSGDLKIDSAGDITLDADGGDIIFEDASTEIGRFTNDSTDFAIQSSVLNKDIVFKGNDGGSTITAMRLDISNKGRVTIGSNNFPLERLSVFGEDNTAAATLKVKDTDSRGVLIESPYSGFGVGYIGTDGTNSSLGFKVNGTEVGRFSTSGFFGVGTNNPQEEIHINGADPSIRIQDSDGGLTTITQAGNDLSFDVPGQINLDADSNGLITINDGGTQVGSFFKTASTFSIKSDIQDKRLEIKGNDGGSEVTAVAFHMANAGQANFNDKIVLNANKVIEFGDSGETISGDGTDLTIASSNDATIDVAGQINLDASDIGRIHLMHDGTTYAHILRSGQNLEIKSSISDGDFEVHGNDGGVSINAFKLDMSEAGAATFNDKVILGANKSIEFGDAGETISGDGTDLTIASSRHIKLDATNDITLDAGAGGVKFDDDGTTIGLLFNASGDLTFKVVQQDKDLNIKGNDGGSEITALSLDMSNAGAATFNAGITATTGTFSGTVTANGEVLSAGVSAGFAVAMAIAL